MHDTLTFEPPDAVDFSQIRYGFDTLNIVNGGAAGGGEGFHNARNQFDVNNDGFVSPIDALGVINSLNKGGSRGLNSGNGEGEGGSHLYIDVNADGSLSPIDALLVINRLNSRGSGEGESSEDLSVGATVESTASMVEAESKVSETNIGEVSAVPLVSHPIVTRFSGGGYGSARNDLFAGLDDEEASKESIDDLLDQIAPDIEETWKRRFALKSVSGI